MSDEDTFGAICAVWDAAVKGFYPKQEYLREQLENLQRWLGLEEKPPPK